MYFGIKAAFFFVAGVVGLVGVIRRSHGRAAKRAMIAAAPTEFEDNALVTFTGTVKLVVGEQLVAPLSGKRCVAYRAEASTSRSLRVRQMSGRGDHVGGQHVVEIRLVPFVLATESGDVIVDAETCELLVPVLPLIPRKLAREQRFIDRSGLATPLRMAFFEELRIELGAKIKVHGVSRSEGVATGGETGFREAPTRILLTGDDAHPLTIDRA
jgi:hypothetical protein